MSFRRTLAQWRPGFRPLPDRSSVAAFAATLGAASSGLDDRPVEELSAVAVRLVGAIHRGIRPAIRDWNRAAWCLWTTEPAIAEDETALDAVLGRVAAARGPRPYRQLASVYVSEFRADRPRLDRVAAVLRERSGFAGEPWVSLQSRFGLFDGREAPPPIARAALRANGSVVRLLCEAGLARLDTRAGLVEACYVAGLDALRGASGPSTPDRIERIRSFCLDESGRLAFPQHRAAIGRAVVLPFEHSVLSEGDVRLLCGFVLDLFGDPRVRRGDWIGMDDVAAIVRRWLVRASLRQFLDVVDRVAPQQQWEYRRAFWTAVYDAGLIDDAYVAFDPAGAKEASRAFRGEAPFGRLRTDDGPIQEGHSVLLLRIGRSVITDWSHNGRCNIWESADDPHAPSLHQSSYGRNDLRKVLPSTLDETQRNRLGVYTHSGAQNYLWQRRVAEHLHRSTGIRIPPGSYTV